jgi:hypothetical protein
MMMPSSLNIRYYRIYIEEVWCFCVVRDATKKPTMDVIRKQDRP